MIEGTSCSQIFSQKSAWQEKAFNELKDSLTATRENRLIRYQDEKQTYLVMICGKAQVGKSTLILKLIGIRDENFKEVYDTLRAGSQQGNSSTVTAIIYAKSATEQYALSFARLDEPIPKKTYYDAPNMKVALQQVRRNVENGSHTSAEEILFIDIPSHFFREDAEVGSLQIVDMPGVESRNEKEWVHVRNLMDSYLPLSQVCIIACNAADIQSLGTMKLPGKISWSNRPERFMVVTTASYSQANVQEYFGTARPDRTESFSKFISDLYGQIFKSVMGGKTDLELYPIDLGQSLDTMLPDLETEDAEEVRALLEETLRELRISILKREGRRFQAAIEDLRSRVDSYAMGDIAAIDQKIREKESEDKRLESRIEKAKNALKKLESNWEDDEDCENELEWLQKRYDRLNNAENQLKILTDHFAIETGEKINEEVTELIDREHLYREKSSGRYLKDQLCSERDRLADKKTLATALKTLKSQLETYWESVCTIYENAKLESPEKGRFPELEIIENARVTYSPKYYPKSFFAKVLCSDLKDLNFQMATEARGTIWYKCLKVWCQEIEEEMHITERKRSELRRIIYEKRAIQERAEQEKTSIKNTLDELQSRKEAFEKIRKKDQKRLEGYLEVAKRWYLDQRNEILGHIRDGISAEEKTKWVLMLALTDREYENLRRTGNGCEA